MEQTTLLLVGGAWLSGTLSTSVLVFFLQRQGAMEVRLLTDLLARQEERQRCLGWLRQLAWAPMPIELRERYYTIVDGVQAGGQPPAAA